MSNPGSSHFVARCPHCGGKAKARIEHAGRPSRCPGCREVFTLELPKEEAELANQEAPALSAEASSSAPPSPAPPSSAPPSSGSGAEIVPSFVGFDCRHCGTRLSVAQKYVGRKIECPDCGVATVAPAPPMPRAANIPAALQGDQYELYEGEEQPWAADLIAQQQVHWPVLCRQCQTLMHAPPDREGQPLTCPDCGVATVVKRPLPTKVIGASTPTGEAYDVAPPEATQEVSEATKAYLQAAQAEAEDTANRDSAVSGPRPQLPRWPLLQGVFSFRHSEGMAPRAIVLAGWLAIIGLLIAFALPALAGMAGGRVAVATGVIMGVCLLMGAVVIGVLWMGYFSALAMLIVTESSEGNDQIHGRPSTNPTDWFGESIYLTFALLAAAAPGWIIARLFSGDALGVTLGTAASIVALFPLTLLSQLDLDSPWALLSPRVLLGLCQAPFSWLLLMAESVLLAAAPLAAIVATAQWSTLVIIVAALPVVAAAMVYFRLLGRLAWTLREAALD